MRLMPRDLKVVEPREGLLFAFTWPRPFAVEGVENLVQRIVKNLHTAPGEDEFDPDWGSDLRGLIQGIPGQDLEGARHAVSSALRKCETDLSEDQPDDPAQRLVGFTLDDLAYDPDTTSWRARVIVETEETRFAVSVGV